MQRIKEILTGRFVYYHLITTIPRVCVFCLVYNTMFRRFHSLKDSSSAISQQTIQELFRKKSIASTLTDTKQLKRCLGVLDLTAFGLGAIIGI